MGALCVSIDLDELRCYCDIHGLADPELRARNTVHERALPRAIRFLEEVGVVGTWFAVGRDLEACPGAGAVLKEAVAAGAEVGNHTHGHRYDLTALPDAEIRDEIARGGASILQAVGTAPRGFRAPGYNVNRAVLAALTELGYGYDSSVFPCPSYFAAKALAIAAKSALGLRSESLVGDPRMAMAPTRPYRTSVEGPFSEGQGLPELPIAVVTGARLPLIGTALALAGPVFAGRLAAQARGLGFVNIELHGIDFVDADGDGVAALARHQPDLKVSLVKKLAAFERAIKTLLDAGAQPMTLNEAAGRLLV